MNDHGFIPLGKYSSARDSILHFLCTSEWSNDSFGSVEAPTGYVWRISNDRQDIFGTFDQGNMEFDSVLEEWFTDNPEVTDSTELRKELVGHFLVIEDSNGFVSVEQYTSGVALAHAFNTQQEEFNAWDTEDEENN